VRLARPVEFDHERGLLPGIQGSLCQVVIHAGQVVLHTVRLVEHPQVGCPELRALIDGPVVRGAELLQRDSAKDDGLLLRVLAH
jgi:hypothetical protein